MMMLYETHLVPPGPLAGNSELRVEGVGLPSNKVGRDFECKYLLTSQPRERRLVNEIRIPEIRTLADRAGTCLCRYVE